MRSIILAVLAVSLAACTTARVSEEYSFENGTNEALAVFSTRLNDGCGGSMNSVSLNYEGITGNGREAGAFLLTNPLIEHDFTDPPGYFHIRKFHAGEYRFTRLAKTSMAGSFRGRNDLNIMFRVAPGKLYYLGELIVDMPDCSRFNLRISDQRQRDGALFDKRMKNLNSSQFVYLPLAGRKATK
jgi:hypothetical protein